MDKKGKKKQENDMIKPKILVNVVPKKEFTISFDMAVFNGNVDEYESPKAADKLAEVKRNKRCVIL